MKPKLEQKLELTIDPEAVMTSFCWSYANSLLEKLEELRKTGRVFDEDRPTYLTDVGYAVAESLGDQIKFRGINRYNCNPEELANLQNLAREFLAAFETR